MLETGFLAAAHLCRVCCVSSVSSFTSVSGLVFSFRPSLMPCFSFALNTSLVTIGSLCGLFLEHQPVWMLWKDSRSCVFLSSLNTELDSSVINQFNALYKRISPKLSRSHCTSKSKFIFLIKKQMKPILEKLNEYFQKMTLFWKSAHAHPRLGEVCLSNGCSAVNGCRQNESPNITIIHTTPVHQLTNTFLYFHIQETNEETNSSTPEDEYIFS